MEVSDIVMRSLEYVHSYDNNLMCPICRSPFVDAVVVSDCEHHFCRDCLERTQTWNQTSGNCPTCRRPGRLNGRGIASKVLVNILDDLVVKCPTLGCDKEVKRGQVLDHVNIYCQYALVACSDPECEKQAYRKDGAQCLHSAVSCLACRKAMTLVDLESHWSDECADHDIPCRFCGSSIAYRTQQSHVTLTCPESNVPCPAHQIGCTFVSKRKHVSDHVQHCSLAQLAPYLEQRKQHQDNQDEARGLLEKKVADLQQQLAEYRLSAHSTPFNRPPSTPSWSSPHRPMPDLDLDLPLPASSAEDPQPYASPTQHLLSLHENLRDEVTRQATTIHEVDARLSMMLLNENMRLKDELAYQGAQLSALMRQVGWLTSARLQGLQNMSTPTPADHAAAAAQSSAEPSRIPSRLSVRRITDEGRTKL